MKTVDFFGTNTGRLVMGGNPINGWSYITEKISRDEMMDYYTAENAIAALVVLQQI